MCYWVGLRGVSLGGFNGSVHWVDLMGVSLGGFNGCVIGWV